MISASNAESPLANAATSSVSRSARLRAAWASAGSPGVGAAGVWCVLPDPVTTELLGGCGFDYLCVDLQHGMVSGTGLTRVMQAVRHVPTPILVRVPELNDAHIGRALDLGADGVIVPLVNDAVQAAAAVAAAAYPPQGHRSWGPMWGDVVGGVPSPGQANADVLVIAMIETADGLANAAEIAAVPGLDAIYLGPNDLAMSCGWGRDTYDTNPEVHAAIDTVLAACTAAGIPLGLHCATPAMARYWTGRGVAMVTVATDGTVMRAGALAALAATRTGGVGE